MKRVKALVLTGYGLNCDYETHYCLESAGADCERVHINEVLNRSKEMKGTALDPYHILVFCGGFSWGDDHGAGVLMASKLRHHLDEDLIRFLEQNKLVLGICNGFQALVNLGMLPAFHNDYTKRTVALTYNDTGNFIDIWVRVRINADSPCIFTKGLEEMELPVRHGEGKFYAPKDTLNKLLENRQVVMQYALKNGEPAQGKWPENPNGSLVDIAGICDPTGRVFGLMPHPEAFNHYTNHPAWAYYQERNRRKGMGLKPLEPQGMKIFQNAIKFASTI